MRSWLIGGDPECDVVVDSPIVSARHCQLTQTSEGLFLSDLASTNGVHVNGVKIAAPTLLKPGDSITLGRTVPFTWPKELTKSIRIGRLADNDVVLDDPKVSGYHARLVVIPGFQAVVEDLGSSNGTFLNSPDRRISAATSVTPSSVLFFGPVEVPVAQLLALIDPPALTNAPSAATTAKSILSGPASTKQSVGFGLADVRWLAAWFGQAPLLGLLTAAVSGKALAMPVTPENATSIGNGIGASSFWIALAAIWLGSSLILGEILAGRHHARDTTHNGANFFISFGPRTALLAGLCAAACFVLLIVGYLASGPRGLIATMWGVLTLASLSGLFLALAVGMLIPNKTAAVAALIGCLVAMIVFGGYLLPLPKMNTALRFASAAMPSRWAFEALFLLQLQQLDRPGVADVKDRPPAEDVAEPFFRAEFERMGPRADTLALGSMTIGLAALSIFVLGSRRSTL